MQNLNSADLKLPCDALMVEGVSPLSKVVFECEFLVNLRGESSVILPSCHFLAQAVG